MRSRLLGLYQKLLRSFGPQFWWPAENAFEVIVGAILTQNTNWQNVEKAIKNLQRQQLLEPKKLSHLPRQKLAELIKPAGYYNLKAKRLKEFLRFFFKAYDGKIKNMALESLQDLRQELLGVNGIGPETADSILLYALDKPIFVVDAYTKRILSRQKIIFADTSYEETQRLFMRNLKNEAKLFNEYHALLVKLGKDFCLKNNPQCDACPIKKERGCVK